MVRGRCHVCRRWKVPAFTPSPAVCGPECRAELNCERLIFAVLFVLVGRPGWTCTADMARVTDLAVCTVAAVVARMQRRGWVISQRRPVGHRTPRRRRGYRLTSSGARMARLVADTVTPEAITRPVLMGAAR